MKIQEAIKSGKRFRRTEWRSDDVVVWDGLFRYISGAGTRWGMPYISPADILTDDWETRGA